MIKIKLLPRGKKHQITYRIVIAEQRSKFDGKYIDDLGFYTPQTKTLTIDKDKLVDWQKKGAKLTQGVDKLLNPDKYPKKVKKKKEAKIKEEAAPQEVDSKKTEDDKQPQEAPATEASQPIKTE